MSGKLCWECRRRRLVCDGNEPGCSRCLSDGNTCPGYGPQKPIRFKPVNTPASRQFRAEKRNPSRRVLQQDDTAATAVVNRQRGTVGTKSIDRSSLLTASDAQILQYSHLNQTMERLQRLDHLILSVFPDLPSDRTNAARNDSALSILRNAQHRYPRLRFLLESISCEAAVQALSGTPEDHSRRCQAYESRAMALKHLNTLLDPKVKAWRIKHSGLITIAIVLLQVLDRLGGNDEATMRAHQYGLNAHLHTCGTDYAPSLSYMFENHRLQTFLLRLGASENYKHLKMPLWTIPTPSSTSRFAANYSRPWHVLAEPLLDLFDVADSLHFLPRVNRVTLIAQVYTAIDRTRQTMSIFRGSSFDESPSPADQVHKIKLADHLEHFNPEIEEHVFMRSFPDPPFTEFFLSEDQRLMKRLTIAWLCLLVADATLLRLSFTSPGFCGDANTKTHDRDSLESSALATARHLCQCFWYFTSFPSLAHARFARVLLLAARGTFLSYEATSSLLSPSSVTLRSKVDVELGWIEGCLVALRVREDRTQRAGRRTFCRVDETANGIEKRCSWSASLG